MALLSNVIERHEPNLERGRDLDGVLLPRLLEKWHAVPQNHELTLSEQQHPLLALRRWRLAQPRHG